MSKLFAIDSMSILYRGYFAMIRNPLINSKGINTSGIFGFLSQIIKIIETEEIDYLAVTTDLADPTFRHKQFPAYKATREKMPDDLVSQLPYLSQLIEALDLPYLSISGYEADDIVGTLMRLCREKEVEGVMVTSDKDYMQLITDRIVMLNNKNEIVDTKKVFDRFGCTPEQVIEVLGLMGDSSDNIPGVRGVGEKTAIKLIQEYGNIANVYDNLDKISGKKLKENLIAGKESALLSRELVTIDTRVPIDIDFDSLKIDREILFKSAAFHDVLEELEFKSFLTRFKPEGGITVKPAAVQKKNYLTIDSVSSLQEAIPQLKKAKSLAFDVIAAGNNVISDRILSLAFCTEQGTVHYLALQASSLSEHLEEVSRLLKEIFEDSSLLLVGHDLKFSIQLLTHYGIQIQENIFDTMVAAHLVESERNYSLENLALAKLKYTRQYSMEGSGKTQQLSILDPEDTQTRDYLCENAEMILNLQNLLHEQLLQTEMLLPFQNIEMPLVLVLAHLELTGVHFDQQHVREISEDFSARLDQLSEEIYKMAGEKFNINSVLELQNILYEKLALHKTCKIRPKKIKLGNGMSTGEETLEKMSAVPLPRTILDYRMINKLKNTYIDALPSFVNPKTQNIHSSFRQTVAATGRLASDNPNLQNIPIRTADGRRIRQLFIASSPERILVSADYSQIELRVVAHYSKDPTFLEAYRKNLDIHALTAAAIYNIPDDQVSRELRAKAKEVNFGLIYRMGADRLAIVTQTTKNEAKEFIENYFRKYSTIHALQETFLERAKKEGFSSTLMGRRRYLPEINGNGLPKRMAEGAAINTPIQGSAAEIIKMAMINIERRLRAERMCSKMILSVHDELVFDTLKEEETALSHLVKEEMENVLTLEVPLIAEIGKGQNWLEAH
ncbi:MAG: DNA polymerase I [SAR324 cluster bacterium]|nr:DNA polymerase I [SAR324 cluster bacterium]